MKSSKSSDPNSLSRRNFISLASVASVGIGSGALSEANAKELDSKSKKNPLDVPLEWRNKQPGMHYRQLGRTGMMISEVICGGDPVRPGNERPVEVAIEKGLNYLDMAPAYGRGECEKAYSNVITSSSKREKVFMTTKVSGFSSVRDNLYQEIFKGLPGEKQKAIQERAEEMRKERGVDKPGYYFTYWPGQDRSMDPAYISNAMAKDYGHLVDGSKAYQKKIKESLEGSLKRAKTDYFDILMCPHGANSPEEVQVPEIYESFLELKKEGKVRFLGVSTHNDPAGVLGAAADTDKFDVCMCAYNVINGGYLEATIRRAHQEAGMGIIAMKVAMAVATHHKALQPTPNWRIEKVNRIVPGDMKAPLKAYIWALQNPNISAVISNLWNPQFVEENLGITGKKVEFRAG